jgi:hypothetical protein
MPGMLGIRSFAERNSALGNAFLYLYSYQDTGKEKGKDLFVSDSSNECKYYLCLCRRRQMLHISEEDPDLCEGEDLIIGLSSSCVNEKDWCISVKDFGPFLKVDLISGSEIKLHFDCGFGTFSKGYSKTVKNEDLCEDYILDIFKCCKRVKCNKCREVLFEAGKIREHQKLPKEGWKDLIECWSCHANEFGGYSTKEPVYHRQCLYIGVDSVIFGNGLMEEAKCSCFSAGIPIPICDLAFELAKNEDDFVVNPLKFLILRIISISWTNSTFKFIIYSACGKAFLFWVISFITECTFQRAEGTLKQCLKIFWKPLDDSVKAETLREYEVLERCFQREQAEFIQSQLESITASLPKSLRHSSLENFNLCYLSLLQ